MSRKSVLDKIARGIGLEDPEVKKYVEDQKIKQDVRMARYAKTRELIKTLGKQETKHIKPAEKKEN